MSAQDKSMKLNQKQFVEHEDTLIAIGLRGKFSTEHTLSTFDSFHTFEMQQTPKVMMDDTVPFQLDIVVNKTQAEPRKMPVNAIKFTMSEQESLSCMKTFGTLLYAPSEFKVSEIIDRIHVNGSGTVPYVPQEFKALKTVKLFYLKKTGVISYTNQKFKPTNFEEKPCIKERGIVLYKKPKFKMYEPIKTPCMKKIRAILYETSKFKASETVEPYVKEPRIVPYEKPKFKLLNPAEIHFYSKELLFVLHEKSVFKVSEPIDVPCIEEVETILYENPVFKILGTVKRHYVQEINGIPFEISRFIISDPIGKLGVKGIGTIPYKKPRMKESKKLLEASCVKKARHFDKLLESIKDYELPVIEVWNRNLENVSTTLNELKKNVREFSLYV